MASSQDFTFEEAESCIIIIEDQTAFYELENERIEREWVQKCSAMLSHEMKTPIKTIQMLVGTLLTQGLEDKRLVNEFLKHIKTSTQMMTF